MLPGAGDALYPEAVETVNVYVPLGSVNVITPLEDMDVPFRTMDQDVPEGRLVSEKVTENVTMAKVDDTDTGSPLTVKSPEYWDGLYCLLPLAIV